MTGRVVGKNWGLDMNIIHFARYKKNISDKKGAAKFTYGSNVRPLPPLKFDGEALIRDIRDIFGSKSNMFEHDADYKFLDEKI
ncbi:hypothetical protein [Methylobacterium sp. 174MFSha1.1]|uniref:hypothetical protein n=1 Tax=Methylobacterium sp. 174MFSha1.1 TaxID=1502749 RepID=UPI001160D485|nr:hypothetical protein [Methylobacterium sp. 174MFSha1.1]